MKVSRKTKWLLLAGFLALIAGVFGIFYYQWTHSKIEETQYLPEKCDVLIAVNSHALIEDLIKNRDLFHADTGFFSRFKNESGVDLIKPFLIAGSIKDHYISFILSVKDSAKTKAFMGRLDTSGLKSISISLKGNKCYIFMGHKSGLVNASDNELYKRNKEYLTSAFKKEWIKGCVTDISEIKQIQGLSFNHDIRFHSEQKEIDSTSEFKLIFEGLHLQEAVSTTAEPGICLNLPDSLHYQNQWLHTQLKKIIFAGGIDTTGLFQSHGNILIKYTGTTRMPKTSIGYDYDEEFNRVKTTKTTWVPCPLLYASFPAKSDLWWKNTHSDSMQNLKDLNKNIQSAEIVKITNAFGLRFFLYQEKEQAVMKTLILRDVPSCCNTSSYFYYLSDRTKTFGELKELQKYIRIPDDLQSIYLFSEKGNLNLSVAFSAKTGTVFRNIIQTIQFYSRKK